MSLEEYKHEIAQLLEAASVELTCSEINELVDWLRKEGLV